MTPGRAWALIAVFVLTYNLTSRPGGTLSEHADGWIAKHPVLVRAFIFALALHLGNAVPKRLDVFHQFFALREIRPKWRRRSAP